MNTELRVGENVGFRAISNPSIVLLYILAFSFLFFFWFGLVCVSNITDVLQFSPHPRPLTPPPCHDFQIVTTASATRTTNLQERWGNKPQDLAKGTMKGKGSLLSYLRWRFSPVPGTNSSATSSVLSTLVLLINVCLKALWYCPSLTQPLCPCLEMAAANRKLRAWPLSKAYLGESLHILG